MNKDLYEILGVSRNASDDEIKKAFRKLSLKYHPDRQGSKSDAEKKQAEEKFKEVSAAYAVLSDPDKKHKYDTYGTIDDQDIFGSGGGFDDMFDMFGSFFGHHSRNPFTSSQSQKQPGQSIRLQVPITMSEIMMGVKRNIDYDILARCKECNGKGGKDVQTCPHCNGTGMLTRTQRTPFGITQSTSQCPYCHGTGKTVKDKCTKCNGTGFEKVKRTVKLNVPGPIVNNQQVQMRNMGYESKDLGMPDGDLIIEFVYNIDSNKFQVWGNPNNHFIIYEKLPVKWYDCILGEKIKRSLPNRQSVTIEIPACAQEGQQIKAISSGKIEYIYVLNVEMPKYVNKEEKELLNKIKQINKK